MNDINTLMARIEEINAMELPIPANAIDELITLHRRRRGLSSEGKGKKSTSAAAASVLSSIMDEIKGTAPKSPVSIKPGITIKF